MADFTSTDLTNIKTAITDLMAGQRVGSVTIGDRQIRYSEVKLDDLIKLRDIIRADVAASGAGGFANKVRFDNPS